MRFTGEIFERATIRGLADYLLYGVTPVHDSRDYEARLDEPYRQYEDAVMPCYNAIVEMRKNC